MQVRELGLERDMVARGARDVARAARARADFFERLVHGGEHGGVLAHAEIVVRAPDRDFFMRITALMVGHGEIAAMTLEIGENPVAPLSAQNLQPIRENLFVPHRALAVSQT